MKILVLGGNGFIGSHLVNRLLKDNHDVSIFDSHLPDKKLPNVKYLIGNFEKIDEYQDILRGIEVVYHLISTTIPDAQRENILFDIQTNLISTIKLLNFCVDAKIKKIIFCSSGGAIYGNNGKKHSEDDKLVPVYAYGINKLSIELYMNFFYQFYNLDYTILRIANPYGKNHKNKKQGLLNVMIEKLKSKEKMPIYGDGNVIRDYVYIDDVIEALILAIPANKSKVYNIGTGIGHSINELISLLNSVSGDILDIEWLPKRNVDIEKNVLDVSKAHKELNWQPKTNLKDGIQKLIKGD